MLVQVWPEVQALLSEQADGSKNQGDNAMSINDCIKKYAHLPVNECLDCLVKEMPDLLNPDWSVGRSMTKASLRKLIKEWKKKEERDAKWIAKERQELSLRDNERRTISAIIAATMRDALLGYFMDGLHGEQELYADFCVTGILDCDRFTMLARVNGKEFSDTMLLARSGRRMEDEGVYFRIHNYRQFLQKEKEATKDE
jgi:hypothetical protein